MGKGSRNSVQGSDPEIAMAAIAKMRLGESLTQKEAAALRRVEQTQLPHYTEQILTRLPKKEYLRIANRMWPDVKRQAERFGIPCDGPTVNVEHVILWIHDHLATKGRPPKQINVDDPDLDDPLLSSGGTSDALEKCRQEKFRLLRMERMQKEGKLLSAEHVQNCFASVASILRKAGERLQGISEEAADVLYEAIDDGERLVSEMNAQFDASGGVSGMIEKEQQPKPVTPKKTTRRRRPKK